MKTTSLVLVVYYGAVTGRAWAKSWPSLEGLALINATLVAFGCPRRKKSSNNWCSCCGSHWEKSRLMQSANMRCDLFPVLFFCQTSLVTFLRTWWRSKRGGLALTAADWPADSGGANFVSLGLAAIFYSFWRNCLFFADFGLYASSTCLVCWSFFSVFY